MANSKSVAEIKPKEVAVAEALDDEIGQDLQVARSIDALPRDAFSIPFLKLLQPLSPEVQKKMEGYVEGARPGMLYNSVSGTLYEAPIVVVPAHTDIVWVEWIPKEKGGGYVAEYAAGHPRINEAKRDDKGKNTLPNGNILEETHRQYVVLMEKDGGMTPVLISLKNTQRKESKRWNMQILTATVPYNGELHPARHWHYAYTLGVVDAANEKGSWFKWAVGPRIRTTRQQVLAGRDFAKAVIGKEMKADLSEEAEEVGTPAAARVFEHAPEIGDLDDNNLPLFDQ